MMEDLTFEVTINVYPLKPQLMIQTCKGYYTMFLTVRTILFHEEVLKYSCGFIQFLLNILMQNTALYCNLSLSSVSIINETGKCKEDQLLESMCVCVLNARIYIGSHGIFGKIHSLLQDFRD